VNVASAGPDMHDVLADVAVRVFEDCAFLFVDVVDTAAAPVSAEASFSAIIDIDGREKRELVLTAARPLLVEAAANMLGTDADDPEAAGSAEQAIGELLNVVAGSFVARWYGTACECGVGIPKRIPFAAPAPGAVLVTFVAGAGDVLRLELR